MFKSVHTTLVHKLYVTYLMPNTTIHKYTFSRWFKGERCNNPLCMYCCVKLSENLLTNFSQKPKSHLKVTRLQATCIPEWIGRKLCIASSFLFVVPKSRGFWFVLVQLLLFASLNRFLIMISVFRHTFIKFQSFLSRNLFIYKFGNCVQVT